MTRSNNGGVCLNTAPKSQLVTVSAINERDTEEIIILRGLDGVLKLADVVARTNLSQENIVKLAKDNIIMARFTDFDLDAVFQEAEGDDDGGDDISRRIGQLALEMRNVMWRIEGVERSQLGL